MNIFKTVVLMLSFFFVVQITNAQGISIYSRTTALTVRQHIQRQELRSSINRQSLRNRTRRRTAKRGTANNVQPPKKKVATGVSTFTMKEQILPDKFFQDFKGNQREKVAGKLLLNSLWQRYENVALKDGFPANDLAYVFNHYLINNYIVYINHFDKNKNARRIKRNGQSESDAEYKERLDLKITIPVEAKIYNQYRTFLSSDANIKKMTNEQKQMLAELLVTMTNMAFKFYDEGYVSNDQRKLQIASDAAKSNLETLFGVPVEKIKITEDGVSFVD